MAQRHGAACALHDPARSGSDRCGRHLHPPVAVSAPLVAAAGRSHWTLRYDTANLAICYQLECNLYTSCDAAAVAAVHAYARDIAGNVTAVQARGAAPRAPRRVYTPRPAGAVWDARRSLSHVVLPARGVVPRARLVRRDDRWPVAQRHVRGVLRARRRRALGAATGRPVALGCELRAAGL